MMSHLFHSSSQAGRPYPSPLAMMTSGSASRTDSRLTDGTRTRRFQKMFSAPQSLVTSERDCPNKKAEPFRAPLFMHASCNQLLMSWYFFIVILTMVKASPNTIAVTPMSKNEVIGM